MATKAFVLQKLAIPLVVMTLSLAACAGPTVKYNFQKNFNVSNIKGIAILPITLNYRDTTNFTPVQDRSQDSESADIISMELFDANIKVVDRAMLETILEEQHLSLTGIMGPGDYEKIGKIAKVDAIVVGNLNLEKGFGKRSATFNLKVVDVTSGTVIYTSNGNAGDAWGGLNVDNLKRPLITDSARKLKAFLNQNPL